MLKDNGTDREAADGLSGNSRENIWDNGTDNGQAGRAVSGMQSGVKEKDGNGGL